MSIAKLDCHGLTDTGRKRGENEDQFLIADLVKAVRVQATSLSLDDHTEVTGQSQGKVFLVADGMGGNRPDGEPVHWPSTRRSISWSTVCDGLPSDASPPATRKTHRFHSI